MDEPLPKLRLINPDDPEELGRRAEREKAAAAQQREFEISLQGFRVGSVPYLNAVPLTRGLEGEIVLAPPAELAKKLRAGELDAALVSTTEVLFHDLYDVLDGIAVASLGEVRSVFLAHHGELDEIEEIECDPASLTSINLLRVLLAERGLRPSLVSKRSGSGKMAENFLLIGDPGIEFLRSKHDYQIWDLGAAWFEATRLPFVYAVWALRRGVENARLKRELRSARDFGLDTLDHIIRSRTEFDLEFRKDYLGWHIHYHLGADEKKGMARFVELLRKHGSEPVYDPVYVS